jgi:primosomal replication protein N
VETNVLRYTPAGLPVIDLKLEHESSVEQAGQIRQIKASMKAVAFGALAERLIRQSVGSVWQFKGFLATPLKSKHVVFHIQEFEQDLAQPSLPDGVQTPPFTL